MILNDPQDDPQAQTGQTESDGAAVVDVVEPARPETGPRGSKPPISDPPRVGIDEPQTPAPRSRASCLAIIGAIVVLVAACLIIAYALLPIMFNDFAGSTGEGDVEGADRVRSVGRNAPGGGSGGSLRLPGGSPTTLDPALVRDVVSADYMYEIYSGLVTLAADLSIVPDIAESWEVSSSGTTYTFSLREGAVFHDGTPVTSEDVRWSFERACGPDLSSPVAAAYLDDIIGCLDHMAGRAPTVSGVRTIDPLTIELDIDAPKAYFLAKLTYPTAFVLDRRQVESGPAWSRNPNGTGPFKLINFEPEEQLVLARHDEYFGPLAQLDEIIYDLRPIAAVTRYENGELDAAPVGLHDLERVRDPLNPLSHEVLQGEGDLGLQYIGMNTRRPPFDDVNVRRAFNLAIDKQRLADVVLRGAVRPVHTILPPGMPGFDPSLTPYIWDPAAARAALQASSYGGPDGLPQITLHTGQGGGGSPSVQAVVGMIEDALDIDLVVEQSPWELFQEEVSSGEYQAWFLGWSADYADPQDFLDVLFHSDSPLNHTRYDSPESDRLLEEARVEQDTVARLALYNRAERTILDDAPWVPLYTGVDTWLVAPEVQGFSLPPVIVPRMAAVRLVR